jgi:hypothetical protein
MKSSHGYIDFKAVSPVLWSQAARDMRPNEFYTPQYIIEITRACLGGIDLDPACRRE